MSDKFNETTTFNTLAISSLRKSTHPEKAEGKSRSMTLSHQATVWRHCCIKIHFVHPACARPLEYTVFYTVWNIRYVPRTSNRIQANGTQLSWVCMVQCLDAGQGGWADDGEAIDEAAQRHTDRHALLRKQHRLDVRVERVGTAP